MPCIAFKGPGNYPRTIVCFAPPATRLRLADGRHVFMEWQRYLGPSFFHDRACERPIEDWWEDEEICNALDWYQQRGRIA